MTLPNTVALSEILNSMIATNKDLKEFLSAIIGQKELFIAYPRNHDRDVKIHRMREAGRTYGEIAREFKGEGLGRKAIEKICKRFDGMISEMKDVLLTIVENDNTWCKRLVEKYRADKQDGDI